MRNGWSNKYSANTNNFFHPIISVIIFQQLLLLVFQQNANQTKLKGQSTTKQTLGS